MFNIVQDGKAVYLKNSTIHSKPLFLREKNTDSYSRIRNGKVLKLSLQQVHQEVRHTVNSVDVML